MKKVVIVSPMLPCGVTWLVNCFLELGIKTYRTPNANNMWEQKGDVFFLQPQENDLKRHLPILSRLDAFNFIENIEVEWSHDWPLERFKNCKVIYFIRDPRDAILSWYKRVNPKLSYSQFVNMPDPYVLLDRIDCWSLFNQLWLESGLDIEVFRFEDYRQDPLLTLNRILRYCEVEYNQSDIARAVDASSLEKAKAAEAEYRKLKGNEEKLLVNRSGKAGEWREIPGEVSEVSNSISNGAWLWLEKFGYQINEVSTLGQAKIFPAQYLNAIPNFDRIIKSPDKSLGPTDLTVIKEMLNSISVKIKNISARELAQYENIHRFSALVLLKTAKSFAHRVSNLETKVNCPSAPSLKQAVLVYWFTVLRFLLGRVAALDIKYFLDLILWMVRKMKTNIGAP